MIRFRKPIRARGFDYSSNREYYVTICTQNRLCLFGKISNGEMILNEAGKMIDLWLNKAMAKFPDWTCEEYVVMPNHIHAILDKDSQSQLVDKLKTESGSGGPACPPIGDTDNPYKSVSLDLNLPYQPQRDASLSVVLQWYKTMTTNAYIRGVHLRNWEPFHGKLWQRSFNDRIISTRMEYQKISEYIADNPRNWERDSLFQWF